MKETAMPAAPPLRIPFDAFLKRYGRSRATGLRWRRLLPWLDILNIFGRLYISVDSVRRFEEMAARGEFAIHMRPPQGRRPARRAIAPRPVKFAGRARSAKSKAKPKS